MLSISKFDSTYIPPQGKAGQKHPIWLARREQHPGTEGGMQGQFQWDMNGDTARGLARSWEHLTWTSLMELPLFTLSVFSEEIQKGRPCKGEPGTEGTMRFITNLQQNPSRSISELLSEFSPFARHQHPQRWKHPSVFCLCL